jgi:hypothetical protein
MSLALGDPGTEEIVEAGLARCEVGLVLRALRSRGGPLGRVGLGRSFGRHVCRSSLLGRCECELSTPNGERSTLA